MIRFCVICETFEKLEKTSKRLEKILILRDFYEKNPNESPLIFDMISGNFQRESNKKNIGISLKTIFSVLSFITGASEIEIEKKFNKIGDIGEVAKIYLENKNQKSLSQKDLYLEEIVKSLDNIAITSGTNKNKKKKEVLANLFIYAKTDMEYKYLARLLIDDLRIGVSEGVLREACVNSVFPKVIGINIICNDCGYINLNNPKCLNCGASLDIKNQYNIIESIKDYNIMSIEKTDNWENQIKFFDKTIENSNINNNKNNKIFLYYENSREIYNYFISLFEKKYNTINSFRKVFSQIQESSQNLLKAEIILGNPLKSMLGTRAKDIKESFEISGKPALIDFKYDGLRIQIHNDKGKITLFSRNLDDITKQFPEVVEYIKENFSNMSFVMDSECVGFDFKTGKFLPFQTLSRRILSKEISDVEHIKVVVKAFDLLYYDNKTIIDLPYEERREILENMFIDKTIKQKLNFDIEDYLKNKNFT